MFMLKKILAVITLAAALFLVGQIALPSGGDNQSHKASQVRRLATVVQRFTGAIPVKEKASLKQTSLKLTGDEQTSDQNFQVLHKTAALTGPGTVIGHTAYNYQTNDNLKDRIIWDPATGTIHAQWMHGRLAEAPNFSSRADRYNFFNGTSWVFMSPGDEGQPIEAERSGYGSLAVDGSNTAVPVSHANALNNEGTVAYLDFQAGYGFFSPLKVYRKTDNAQPRLEPLWPDIAVDRQGNYHAVAINNSTSETGNTVLNGVVQNILYWKSTNKGQSWSNYRILFPNITAFPLEGNRSDGVQIAVSDTDNGKVGILVGSAVHTFYFFESTDGGNTWNDGINILGKPRLGDPEAFATIPQQFDVVLVDSTSFGKGIDTAFVEYGDYVSNGPADNRPIGPSDLMYINGEPHVVWNEVFGLSGASYYPAGFGYSFNTPTVRLLKGGNSHVEGGYYLKHWSPSTGVSVIAREDRSPDAWPGTNYYWLSSPQIGVDQSGNLYCLYTRFNDTDTIRVAGQDEFRWGPLSRGEVWGAKSIDKGATWLESVNLSQTRGEDERYVGVSDRNPNDVLHTIYQTSNSAGSAVNDHTTWVNAEIRHWAVPTSMFPATPQTKEPEIDLSDGVLDFLNTPGVATRSFTVSNRGTADLVVDDVFTTDSQFQANPRGFTVPPGGQQEVTITYRARFVTSDTLQVLVGIPNNDPSEHSRALVILATATTTSVASRDASAIPSQYALEQNYPNPISVTGKSKLTAPSTTEIRYALKANGHASIRIFDVLGREIAILVNELKPAGQHRVTWQPHGVTAGIYFYSLEVNGFRETKKLVVLP
jgi:hypothetical protein